MLRLSDGIYIRTLLHIGRVVSVWNTGTRQVEHSMTRLPFAMENIGPYTHNNARVILFCCPFWLPEKEKKKETFHSKSCCCCLAKRTTINRGTVTNRPTPARGTELNATKWNNGGGGTHTGKWRRAHSSRRDFCPRQTKKLNQFLSSFLQILEIPTHENSPPRYQKTTYSPYSPPYSFVSAFIRTSR